MVLLFIDIPRRAPFKTPVVVDRTIDTERSTLEPPEYAHDRECCYAEHDPFCSFGQAPRGEHEMVKHMSRHQYGEVKRGQIVVDVGHTTHYQERHEM